MADNTQLLDHLNTLKIKIEAMKNPAPPPPPDDQPLIDAADEVVVSLLALLP